VATPKQVRRRGRWTLVIGTILAALAVGAVAYADNVSNTLDNTLDPALENMALTVGGPNGSTTFYLAATTGDDAKSGCNLTGPGSQLVANVSSSNTSVATVGSSTVTVTACGTFAAGPYSAPLTVHPVAAGTATITLTFNTVTTTSAATSSSDYSFAGASFTVNVTASDATAPSISYSQTPNGSDGWFKTAPATVTVTATDPDDNVASIDCTLDGSPVSLSNTSGIGTSMTASGDVSTSADGNHTVSCTATDSNGNTTSPAQTTSLKLDTVAPSITDTGFVSGTAGSNGWYVSAVENGFSASDATSGLADCATTFNKSSGGAEGSAVTIASGPCSDNAGNTNPGIGSAAYMVDLTDPTVTCNPENPTFTLNQAGAQVSADVTDSVSGPASSPVTAAADTSSIGSHSVNLTGYDNAGRSATTACYYSVIYDFAGFFQPVDNPPVCNKVKAGQAIPVKFSLSGNQGLDIFEAGYPKSQPGTCAGSPTDALEETMTAGNSSLSYDATADQYIYVWKTDKAWAGTARLLTVMLIDGTTHTARFTFTK
jgi:hypothetical protein